ncbi:unnamed protein product [Trichobilharzia regenti]|nr:unnamed protein product [Trichobilharzia regenti]
MSGQARRKVSNAELLLKCNDMYDAQHDETVVHVSPSRDNRNIKLPKYEPRCFDGNPADYPQFLKEFELRDNPEELVEFLDNLMVYRNTTVYLNNMDELNSVSVIETVVKKLPDRLQRKFIKVNSRLEEDGLEPGFDDIVRLVKDSVNQVTGEFAGILYSKVEPKEPVIIKKPFVVKLKAQQERMSVLFAITRIN